ncbi:MAG: cytochrome c [Fimbriimonadaceae bacterium]|nr:cytochrome c [Fimbriimonadaceae bacterium]
MFRWLSFVILCSVVTLGLAQTSDLQKTASEHKDVFSTSNCMGCHGQNGMGGLGPPIVKGSLEYEHFLKVVREGKGMMPATSKADLSDDKLRAIYDELQSKAWLPHEIPIAYKVGQFLSTKNVSRIFLGVFLFAAIFAIRGLGLWFRAAGFAQLWPRLLKMGLFKSLGIAMKAFIVDGFLVSSLWKKSKHRWLMHGLILYGFCGLLAADILMAIYNPTRSQLPLTNPLKLLPVLSGIAVLMGVSFVMVRYRKDNYIDNGLTLGKDFLFVNLLFHTVVSGFLTVVLKRFGIHDWVMTIYLYHLASITLLIATAPFTRFQHVWVVPIMVALTRLTDAVAESGVDIGFEREPSPGRHHKSERIAANVMEQLGPEYDGPIRLRYYP